MLAESVTHDFQEKVSAQVRLHPEGVGRYRVFTPFRFDDGDHLAIVLKREPPGWTLSDEGHTYMRLTYDGDAADLLTGTRQQILADTLAMFQVSDRDGELALPVPEERYGDALFPLSKPWSKSPIFPIFPGNISVQLSARTFRTCFPKSSLRNGSVSVGMTRSGICRGNTRSTAALTVCRNRFLPTDC